mgnify:CR=1 FL=1
MKKILETKNSKDYLGNIKILLDNKLCNRQLKLEFVYHCAKDLDKYYDVNKYPEIYKTREICLTLLADYILTENSDLIFKLKGAANAAYAAADTHTANAAYAAEYAAYNDAY